MVNKNKVVFLLSGSLMMCSTMANSKLILNDKITDYNSLVMVEPSQIKYSQIPNDKSISKLMEILNLDNSIDEIIGKSETKRQAMISAIYSSIGIDETKIDNLTNEKKDKLAKINDFIGAYADYIYDNRKEEMLDVYRRDLHQTLKSTYTQQEIDAQINFYSTPVGRKIIEKQSTFNKKYYDSTLPKILKIQNENIKEAVIKLSEDIESLQHQ